MIGTFSRHFHIRDVRRDECFHHNLAVRQFLNLLRYDAKVVYLLMILVFSLRQPVFTTFIVLQIYQREYSDKHFKVLKMKHENRRNTYN